MTLLNPTPQLLSISQTDSSHKRLLFPGASHSSACERSAASGMASSGSRNHQHDSAGDRQAGHDRRDLFCPFRFGCRDQVSDFENHFAICVGNTSISNDKRSRDDQNKTDHKYGWASHNTTLLWTMTKKENHSAIAMWDQNKEVRNSLLFRRLDNASSLDDSNQHNNDRNQQQQMDKSAQSSRCHHAQCPKQ
jgi:hypothetical protein